MTPSHSSLLQRVKAAKCGDRELDFAVTATLLNGRKVPYDGLSVLVDPNNEFIPVTALTSSIDAALALVERKLPGSGIVILRLAVDDVFRQHMQGICDGPRDEWLKFLPLAIIAALLENSQ